MMPLCTTTILPVQSRCGCAFSSVGRPCVAQRVWPMPYVPSSGFMRIMFSRLRSFPSTRRIWRPSPLPETAIPAESYPRYSRPPQTVENDGDNLLLAQRILTMPHMVSSCFNAADQLGEGVRQFNQSGAGPVFELRIGL